MIPSERFSGFPGNLVELEDFFLFSFHKHTDDTHRYNTLGLMATHASEYFMTKKPGSEGFTYLHEARLVINWKFTETFAFTGNQSHRHSVVVSAVGGQLSEM